MIDISGMKSVIPRGLKSYIGAKVIRGNQTAEKPPYPYSAYNITTIETANNGTWQQHADGIDRKLVRSIWSFTFLSDDWDESVMLATKAREWFEHSGRTYLADHGIIVQSTTDITNRDNILTVEYERKNGFDVVFSVFNEVESPLKQIGHIESAELYRKTEEE